MLAALWVVAATAYGHAESNATPSANDVKPASPSDVARWIEQLGSDDFALRGLAERRLLDCGVDAFDQLTAATADADLEIAARAEYVLQHARIDWIEPADSEEVRQLLQQFAEQSPGERNRRLVALAKLSRGAGLPALCRVARYELSPRIARLASLSALAAADGALRRHAQSCRRQLGQGIRPPVAWLRLRLHELDEPPADVAAWLEQLTAEQRLLTDDPSQTSSGLVLQLLSQVLGAAEQRGQLSAAAELLDQLVELRAERAGGDLSTGLVAALDRLIADRQWELLERFQRRRGDQLQSTPLVQYYLAAALRKADRRAEADRQAQQAYARADEERPGDTSRERLRGEQRRNAMAALLARLDCVDWCEREYEGVIARGPANGVNEATLEARRELAAWQADRLDFAAAAHTLGAVSRALDRDPKAKAALYEGLRRRGFDAQEWVQDSLALAKYYEACGADKRGDAAAQRRLLREATAINEQNPDILIAMYRAPGGDAEFRTDVLVRIRRVAKYFQAQIDEQPDDPSKYNQWAWLIANTEGDFRQAVAYSQKSLDLAPGEPSFLDTLARCQYAAGDLKAAIKSQRKAVQAAPQYQVMRRQLELFERQLTVSSK